MAEGNPQRYDGGTPYAEGIQHPEDSQQNISPRHSHAMMMQPMLHPCLVLQGMPTPAIASGMQQNILAQPLHHNFAYPTSALANPVYPISVPANPLLYPANCGPDEFHQYTYQHPSVYRPGHQNAPLAGLGTYVESSNLDVIRPSLPPVSGNIEQQLAFGEIAANNTAIMGQHGLSNIGPASDTNSLLHFGQLNISGAGNLCPEVLFSPMDAFAVPISTTSWQVLGSRPLTAGPQLSRPYCPPIPQRLIESLSSEFPIDSAQLRRSRNVRAPDVDAVLVEVRSRLSRLAGPSHVVPRNDNPPAVVGRARANPPNVIVSETAPQESGYASPANPSELSLPDPEQIRRLENSAAAKSRQALDKDNSPRNDVDNTRASRGAGASSGANARVYEEKCGTESKPRGLPKENIWTKRNDNRFWSRYTAGRFSPPNESICSEIVHKAETYLSDKYLAEHRYILDQVQLDGYISGRFLKSYKELHTLIDNWVVVRSAIVRKSKLLVVDDAGKRVKRKGRLPAQIRKSPTLLSAVVGIHLPSAYSALERLTNLFKRFGTLKSVDVYKPGSARPAWLCGYAILIREFGSALCCVVEFDAVAAAEAAVLMLNKDTRRSQNQEGGSETDTTLPKETEISKRIEGMPDLENARFAKLEPQMLKMLYPMDNTIEEDLGFAIR